MKIAVSTGGKLEYEQAGQGPPVVLLHAFPLAHAMWQPQVQALQKSCRAIALDHRGFGGSDGWTGDPTVERMADDVDALLTALGIHEPIVLGGLSMGGYVAFAFVRKYPNRLRALVLADTRAEADTPEGKSNRAKLIALAERGTARDVLDQMMPKMVSDETRKRRPQVIEEVLRLGSAQSSAGVAAALRAMRDRPDSTPILGHISVPTLVIVGSDDALTPPSASETIRAGIPGAQLVSIQGAGHLSNLEQPDDFNAAVERFLTGLR